MGDEAKRSRDQTVTRLFTAAYQQLSPRVLGYLRSHGVDDPEAITHEVFLALYQNFDRITGGDDGVRTMTFSIAHARLVDHYRARAVRPAGVPFEADSDFRSSPSAEDIAVDMIGESGALGRLKALNREQREAVTLRVIAGLSLDETAQVMGKSTGAIKQLQRRGLESLRHALDGGGGDD